MENSEKILELLAPHKNKIAANDFTWMSEGGPRITRYLTDLINLFTQVGIEPFTSTSTRNVTRLLSLIRGVISAQMESDNLQAGDREQVVRFAQAVGLEVYEVNDPQLNAICSNLLLLVRPERLQEALNLPHIQTWLGHPAQATKKLTRI